MSDQRALLRRLFVVLQQQFELHRLGAKEEESSDARSYPSNPANPANPVDPSSGGIPAAAVVPLFSTLQFHVDRSVWHYEWGATVTLDEYVSSYPRSACSVTADGKTLLDLVRGGKVMAAFITGRLSVKGDTAVFKRSGGVLRRAFAALRGEMDREKAEAEAQGGQGLGQGVQGRGRGITVVITEAVARSFVYSPMKGGNGNGNGGGNGGGNGNGGGGGDTNGELRVSMGGRGESATRYRVEVTDSEGRTWHVVHRYSSFVALRRELRLLSPARLPTLSQRPYLFPGLSLAQSRAALLDTFIKQCVELDSEALSVFLDLDRRHGPAEGSLSQASNGGYSASASGGASLYAAYSTPHTPAPHTSGPPHTPSRPHIGSETSPAPFSASASTPASASYASSASASASVSAWAGGATARNRAFQEQRREAHMHATSTPISWNSAQLGQGRFLVQELQQLNKMAERDGGGGGDKLGRVLSLLGEGALVAVLGVLAYHFMEHDYSYPFTDLLSPLSPSPPSPLSPLSLSPSLLAPSLLSLRLCAVCRLTTVLLLATTPTRRRRTVLCFLLWVVVIHGAGEGLAGLGRVLVVYWEGVETAVGIASADFVCASAASAAAAASTAANASAASASAVALWRTLPFLRLIPGIGAGVGASVGAGWGGVGAGICAAPTPTPTLLPLLLASLPSVLWAMLPFQRLLIVLLNLLLSLLPQSADLEVGVGALALLCAILGVTLSSPGVARAARIYSLGVGLISLYAGLQLVCRIARLDTATQGALFSSVDQIVAPFMASQISHLRSVFVKFGQYFGARSDLVGPAWTGTFKSLQDCCPPDSAAYVRATVERALAECLAAGEGAGAGAVGGSNTSAGVGTGVGAGVAGGGTVGGTGAPTLEDFFDSFDLSPLASASIAQVHTATLKAGAMERLRPRQAQGQGQGLFNGDSGDSGDRNGGGGVHTRTNPHTPSTHTHAHNEHTHGPTELDRLLVFSAAATDPEFVAGTAARAGDGGMGGMGGMGDMGGMSGGMGMGGGMGGGMGMGEQSPLPPLPPLPCPLRVVVKVQHEGVSPLMRADMRIVLLLVTWAARLDDRWQAMVSVLQSWERTMQDELDFHQEAANLREMGSIMAASSMGAVVPMPLPGLVSREVLGMTRLFGHKVTDRVALQVHGVDRGALLLRLAHCCAWQLLVAGVFNADPHAGNLMFCLARTPRRLYAHDGTDTHTHTHTDTHIHTHSGTGAQWGASDAGAGGEWGGAGGPGGGVGGGVECELVPGLLDFGMTVRLLPERRRAYCRLILALFDGDLVGAATELRGVGYLSNQSDRAPERDAEFFEFLFRDAHPTGVSSQERSAFNSKREAQKAADIAQGTREKGGRAIASMPEDFLLLTRLVGLLRGLTAELDASCPILQVLYEHAQVGVHA